MRSAMLTALALMLMLSGNVGAQGRGAAAQTPPTTPRATAPFDPTGYWVAII